MRGPAAVLVLLALFPGPVAAQSGAGDEGCGLCHGEVELLRQHVASLSDARRLVATRGQIEGSAHAGMACSRCHSGFERFPHEAGGESEGCASCHEEARDVWVQGIHADPEQEGVTRARCTDCHGRHDVLPVEAMSRESGLRATNGRCAGCHDTRGLPARDPHAGTVACAACHAPHGTRDVDDPLARVAPHPQVETCGACHGEEAAAFRQDVHGTALATLDPLGAAEMALRDDAPPSCTACHGGHDIAAPSHERFSQEMVAGCAACHGGHADTYFGTYHGKATALGSEIAATCDQCHGSHAVYPSSEPRSLVSRANLVETCGQCHDHARPAFVEYDSHPDPLDRERNAPLFLSFVFMNTVLVGVLVVFGLHTLLWWVRLMLDRRKGIEHGIGVDHE